MPLATAPTPVSMLPVPPLNTAVSCVVAPAEMVAGLAPKLVITGVPATVTVTEFLVPPPIPPKLPALST